MKKLIWLSMLFLSFGFTADNSATKIKTDGGTFMVLIRPLSQTVTEGTYYEAEVIPCFIYFPDVKTTIKFEGLEIPARNGMGRVSFTPTAENFNENGVEKKKWRGSVSINWQGVDTSLHFSEDYFVKKAELQITGNIPPYLYKNCKNELQINAPELGYRYNPSFKASGSILIQGEKKGAVSASPTASDVTLNIISNSNLLGELKYKAIEPPACKIEILNNGQSINYINGLEISRLKSLSIKCTADEVFKSSFPLDANYKAAEWIIYQIRGNTIVKEIKFTEETGDLSSLQAGFKSGDRIVVKINKVVRKNFQGKEFPAKAVQKIFTLPVF